YVVHADREVRDELVLDAHDTLTRPADVRARIDDVPGRREDAGIDVVPSTARRGRADQLAPLDQAVAVGVGPARSPGRRVEQTVRLVVAPRQRRPGRKASERVRERDLRVVVVSDVAVHLRLAVAE